MAVIELALFHLKTDLSAVINNLEAAATMQATYSNHPVTLLQCIEDPNLIYLVGGWDSIAQHMEEWIPGPTNQGLMSEMKGTVDVRWMFHITVGPEDVSRVITKVAGDGEGGIEASGVIAVGRYFAKDRKGFEAAYQEGVTGLEGHVRGGKEGLAGGWREDVGFETDEQGVPIDASKDRDLNEFVFFTAWGSVDEHMDFAKTEDFRTWTRIQDFMSGAEIRHGRVLFVVNG